jgi:hypothetical protein
MSATKKDLGMARYAIQPLGNGTHGIYDKSAGKFLPESYSGRGAYRKALREWHTLAGTGVPGMDRNAPKPERKRAR